MRLVRASFHSAPRGGELVTWGLFPVSATQLEIRIEVVVDPAASNDRARVIVIRRVHVNAWRGVPSGVTIDAAESAMGVT